MVHDEAFKFHLAVSLDARQVTGLPVNITQERVMHIFSTQNANISLPKP
jgi:hypothetical protein